MRNLAQKKEQGLRGERGRSGESTHQLGIDVVVPDGGHEKSDPAEGLAFEFEFEAERKRIRRERGTGDRRNRMRGEGKEPSFFLFLLPYRSKSSDEKTTLIFSPWSVFYSYKEIISAALSPAESELHPFVNNTAVPTPTGE